LLNESHIAMTTLDVWLARYGASHRHLVNEAIHWIAVPAIAWSVIALAWWLSPYAAIGLCALALAFYATLSVPVAIGMLVFVALAVEACVRLDRHVAVVAIVVFVVAWIAQFAGHKIEGRKPAFLDDVVFLLIGPAWVLAALMRRLRIPC
jgi:uncharacterized membrane protein YGL010W